MDTQPGPWDLGALLRDYRRRAGFTQRELADRAGVSVRTLRELEQGRVGRPQARSVHRFAAALELSEAQQATVLAARREPADAPGAVSVWVGVQGPLAVRRHGHPVEVGPAMRRDLLGLLAVQPGRVVTCAEIIDVLWGQDPPVTCERLIHLHVGRLRRLLEPDRQKRAPGRILVRSRGGYRLDLAPEQLDLTEFDRLVARARQLTAGDPPEALALFTRALESWRGPVLCDARPELRQHPAVVAVGQRHLTAALAFADLALSLGHNEQVVAWLRPLAAQEPLHEGLTARLMFALAGCGEQAAALELFTGIRARLDEDLGIEPGPELQETYLRVLRGQLPAPALAATPPTATADTAPPAQLPADVAAFTGRADHLRRLEALLAEQDRGDGQARSVVISAIAGTAGIGKTTLAVHWAHQIRDRFPDGQLYVNLRGYDPERPVRTIEALAGFLHALGVRGDQIPEELSQAAATYRSRLADKRILIVLDNARNAEHVRPLLPGAPGCLAVVTSRDQLSGLITAEGARLVALDMLNTGEAADLLGQRIGPDRVAAEPDAVQAIITRCAHLPLALAIVAARAATRPQFSLATLAAELSESRGSLESFTGDDPATDIRAVFSWSYRILGVEAARLFRLLGLHPGPDFGLPAAASLAGMRKEKVRPLLRELARAHLVTEQIPGRFTFHDLLRAYASDLARTHDTAAEQRAVERRILDHYLHTANAASQVLSPHRDPLDLAVPEPGVTPEDLTDYGAAVAWFTAELPVLLAAVAHGPALGLDTHVWQLAWALKSFFDIAGHWQEWVTTHELALDAARRTGDRNGIARTHRNLGRIYSRQARYPEADTHLRRSLELCRELDDPVGQAHALRNIGVLLGRQNQHRPALSYAQQALTLFRTSGHRVGQARVLNLVGWCHGRLGDYAQAITHCQQALDLMQELGDADGEGSTWDSLGYAHRHLGHHREALTCYERSLRLERERGDLREMAETLELLGDAHLDAGESEAARHAWLQALDLLRQLGHPRAQHVRAKLVRLPGSRPVAAKRAPASRIMISSWAHRRPSPVMPATRG
jgi:DNA-binding SARP family transcriptional activator/DNA-binding XRE family transcriptional regulator